MIEWRHKLSATWRAALVGAGICTLLGLVLLRWSNELVLLGYDLLFLWKHGAVPSEVVIIYMEDSSFQELNQTSAGAFDRKLHARLVRKLTVDGARVVVFDVVFDTTNAAATDADFAAAIRENRRVVLAASQVEIERAQFLSKSVIRPIDPFMDAAAGWGVAGIHRPREEGDLARQYFGGDEFTPSLVWAAAKVAGAPVAKGASARQPSTRLNYYGPALTLPSVTYVEALNHPPGRFRDKAVFVGARPKTLRALDVADAFQTPYFRWKRELFPGVEIGATAYLNLLRNEGLVELPIGLQIGCVIAVGVLLGGGLTLLRPGPAIGVAVLALFACVAAALHVATRHFWFGWPVIAFAQIPTALAWSIRGLFFRLKFEQEVLKRTLEETTRLVEATKLTAHKPGQLVSDHEMIRLVGKGAYGEVWLARNAVGVFHAVKVVRRAAFPSDVPYEREFKGIQRFMPVSRSHPGLVHVLHVGRNDAERCFFYIMEAGDDQKSGQKIDPDGYTPKSLASWLAERGQLPSSEILRLGLALTLALEHLHQQRLVHRDIKPGNIIFVNGAPKFADIGLVTDFADEGKSVSFLGTQGYIPPEGPGTAGADVYALGKVLYEAAVGRDRELFPEVPTAIYEEAEDSLRRQLLKIVFKACEMDPLDRYRTAAQMHADLLAIENRLNQQATRTD